MTRVHDQRKGKGGFRLEGRGGESIQADNSVAREREGIQLPSRENLLHKGKGRQINCWEGSNTDPFSTRKEKGATITLRESKKITQTGGGVLSKEEN